MDPERWARVKAVHQSALERDPGERAAFLDHDCCDDRELQREVESLLAQASGDSSLECPAWQTTDPTEGEPESADAVGSPGRRHPFLWVVRVTLAGLVALFGYVAWTMSTWTGLLRISQELPAKQNPDHSLICYGQARYNLAAGLMSISPRNLEAAFLSVAVLFTAVLGWLGWRVLEQDRGLARQRQLDQLGAAADRVTAALYRRLGELDDALEHPSARLPDGAVLIRARRGVVEVRPEGALLYYPVATPAAEPQADVFREGESLEFGRQDPAVAAKAFRVLARSPDPNVRAGALIRLGRTLRKTGHAEEALRVYRELEAMDPYHAGRLPARLVALEARCSVYEQLGRRPDLEREARILYGQLATGRWRLTRAAHEFQVEQARAWLGTVPAVPEWNDKLTLSEAAEEVYQEWLRAPDGKGLRILTANGRPVFVSWRSADGEWSALLAPAGLLGTVLSETGQPAALTDARGSVLLGGIDPRAPLRVDRNPATSRLPWTLQVAALDDGAAEVAGRRPILAGRYCGKGVSSEERFCVAAPNTTGRSQIS